MPLWIHYPVIRRFLSRKQGVKLLLRLLLHLSRLKVLLWGKKERRKEGGQTGRKRGSQREKEEVGERGDSEKPSLQVSAPFIFPTGDCHRQVPMVTSQRCRQVQSLGHQLWFHLASPWQHDLLGQWCLTGQVKVKISTCVLAVGRFAKHHPGISSDPLQQGQGGYHGGPYTSDEDTGAPLCN